MVTNRQQCTGHSSDIRLSMVVNGVTYRLSQTGPDFVLLKIPAELQRGQLAQIVMWVDGSETRWTVTLPEGSTANDRRVAIKDCGYNLLK